jgi:hypothetical protein
MKLCMFRTVPLSIIRTFSLYTQQWYMSYMSADIYHCCVYSDCEQEHLLLHTSCQQTFMTYTIVVCTVIVSRSIYSCSQAVSILVWHIPMLCVQWKSPDDGQRNCPKPVEFHSKNKFEKLVHLVGFILRNLTRCTVTWKSKPYLAYIHLRRMYFRQISLNSFLVIAYI